jgi:tetratricopeptide (TPR) repeat protein
MSVTRPDPDRLAELEEERRFLLRSLADLEREHDAGDVDEVDYRALRDGYTVRAAATLREIEDGKSSLPAKPRADWRRRIAVGVGTLALFGIVWWALTAWSAQRLPGQTPTGLDPRDDRAVIVAQARSLQATDPAGAAELYALALEGDPDDVESLAYRGWTLAISSRGLTDPEEITATLTESADLLGRAIDIDPDYPDSYCFLGIIQANFLGATEAAQPFLEECLAANPPADVRGLVEGLLE